MKWSNKFLGRKNEIKTVRLHPQAQINLLDILSRYLQGHGMILLWISESYTLELDLSIHYIDLYRLERGS